MPRIFELERNTIIMSSLDSLSKFVVWGMPHRCIDDTHVKLLETCLQSIRAIYQWHHIVIVDSDSPKKDHLPQLCEKYNAVVAPQINKNYESGAWKIIYEECKADYYCFIHDSCRLARPLGDTFAVPVAAYRCVPNTPEMWYGLKTVESMRVDVERSLQGTKWSIPDNFMTLVGNMMFADASVVKSLYDNGYFNVLPVNKHEAQCWERRLGACLGHDGYTEMLSKYQNQIGAWSHGKPIDSKIFKRWLKRQ